MTATVQFYNAFLNCKKLTSVNLNEAQIAYTATYSYIYFYHTFFGCDNLHFLDFTFLNMTTPYTIESAKNLTALQNCKHMKVVFPTSTSVISLILEKNPCLNDNLCQNETTNLYFNLAGGNTATENNVQKIHMNMDIIA